MPAISPLLADEERGRAVTQPLTRLGQGEADLADSVEGSPALGGVDHARIVADSEGEVSLRLTCWNT